MGTGSILQLLPGGRYLNQTKDAVVSQRVRARLNQILQSYGTMLDFHLDTATRSVRLKLDLRGEQAPVEIYIQGFQVVREGAQAFLSLEQATIDTSREWLTTFAREQLVRQRVPLSSNVAWILDLLA
jgi:hypothetical protein